jgi:hypothetical protein
MAGKTDAGGMLASLDPTGEKPSFASEPYGYGLDDRIRSSGPLWSRPR